MTGPEIDLAELAGPAVHYMTPAMAMSRQIARGVSYPVSGDHTVRAARIKSNKQRSISDYIELARRKQV